jgi:outer membrane protein OmpA-like peptidoglycan-associated protein
MRRVIKFSAAFFILSLSGAAAQPFQEKVSDIESKVLDIESKVSEIVGIAGGIEGKLKDLGAKVTDKEIVIEFAADLLFDFDKHHLKPDAAESLTEAAEVLKDMDKIFVIIEGHTDSKGSGSYNQKLSERRAESVKEWLVTHGGVKAAGIVSKGFGMTRPVAPNIKPDGSDNPEGRQKNRRVEIRLKSDGLKHD